MCGIAGIISPRPFERRDWLNAMRDTMVHRGPDDAGSWWSADGQVGLAHRRLSIIDLSEGGHQPMRDTQADLTIIFNGEIYNFQSIRDELAEQGVQFHSTCDTEILLEAYRQWGQDCLDKLDGMFAFAIHDTRRQEVFLARDRAGEKPLFYWQHEGQLRFASELKALMACPDMPRVIDPAALNAYLAFGYVPGEQCMLQGLNKLPPGHALRWDMRTNTAKIWRYWDLPEGHHSAPYDEDELLNQLHDLLKGSVRQRMVADVPVGILLSGGVDSSLVTAMAAATSSQPVRTFTICFPGHGSYDEGPYAKLVAEHFGTIHTELHAQPATVDLLPELARQYDEPMADSSMVPTYMVSKLIREHATVALGGDGGDELFGGYPGHCWVQQMIHHRRYWPTILRRIGLPVVRRALALGKKGRNYILGLLSDMPESIVQINMYFDAINRKRLTGPAVALPNQTQQLAPEMYKRHLQKPYQHPLQRITAMDFRSFLIDDILAKVDRASMLTSLEVRAPFLSRALIEFAFRGLPANLRATRSQRKILPKRLAERLLPSELDIHRKQGFSLPLQDWFRGEWGQYCQSVLAESPAGLLRGEMVKRLFAQQAKGYQHTQRLFALTMLELWRREYDIQLPEGLT